MVRLEEAESAELRYISKLTKNETDQKSFDELNCLLDRILFDQLLEEYMDVVDNITKEQLHGFLIKCTRNGNTCNLQEAIQDVSNRSAAV